MSTRSFTRKLSIAHEVFPLKKTFAISRGAKTAADVVVVTLQDGAAIGRGECVPYKRYGETIESVIEQLNGLSNAVAEGMSRDGLLTALPAGSARNALDCALWDLELKHERVDVFEKLSISKTPVTSAYTIPYGDVDNMRDDASANAFRPILKIKLGSRDDVPRLEAVTAAAPQSQLIVDANEGWTIDEFDALAPRLADLGVSVVEQPLPASKDEDLRAGAYPFALCADESCHTIDSLRSVVGRYDMVNIKLDKTGGLTHALSLKEAAQSAGLKIMVGCMVGSSLAMAPAFPLAVDADVVDLDAPLLIAADREPAIQFDGSIMNVPSSALWG